MAMNDDLQKRIAEAIRNPQNVGEMPDADSVGTVGSPDCGEMLRFWIKYKEERGRKVIDRASFQSFGCETAIAVASLATELIRGKTSGEALALKTDQLAGDLGALPPMKIHCAELVQAALRSALEPARPEAGAAVPPAGAMEGSGGSGAPAGSGAESLMDKMNRPSAGGVKIRFLDSPGA